jgi:hypothetical protein
VTQWFAHSKWNLEYVYVYFYFIVTIKIDIRIT